MRQNMQWGHEELGETNTFREELNEEVKKLETSIKKNENAQHRKEEVGEVKFYVTCRTKT